MNKPIFDIVVIARNESQTLPRLIKSVQHFIDRGGNFLVLDTGSSDNTANIARNLGCIVYEVGDKFKINIDKELADKINQKFVVDGDSPVVNEGESLFDFASARNYIATFATNNFIFTPDCDEIFTKFDIDKVEEKIRNGVEQLEYNFVFSHDEFGNPAIKFTHCKAYDRRKLHWEGVIHEILSGSAVKEFLGEDVVYLEHYQNEKTNRSGYLKGLAVDCYNNPKNDRNSHYFARECMYTGRFKTAIKEFKNHITLGGWALEAATSMMYIGDCYLYLNDNDEMLKWYMKSMDYNSDRREPLLKLAEFYFRKGKHKLVVIYAEASLLIKETPFYSNDEKNYRNYPHELLYVSYWWLGDKIKSEEHYRKALAFCPNNKKYIEDGKFYEKREPVEPKLTFVIPTLGREEGLKRCLESIKLLNYPQHKIEIIVKQDSFENRIGVPKLLKQGVEESTGDWIIFGSNDCEFTPECINEALKVGDLGYVAFNTGEIYPDECNINEHFMIRRDIVDKIGEIFDTDFYHCGVDNLLWAKMKKLGINKRADNAILKHYHFAKTGGEMDEVYKLAYSMTEFDRNLLKKKLLELEN